MFPETFSLNEHETNLYQFGIILERTKNNDVKPLLASTEHPARPERESLMSRPIRIAVSSALIAIPLSIAQAHDVSAQELQSFAVVSGQSLTNTGPTTIVGDIAVSPGTSYTGSGTVTQTGALFLGDAVAGHMQNNLATLYTVLAGRQTSSGGNLTGQDLGGKTLSAGVYNFDTSAGLAAGQTLTLDAGGDPNAMFIFNIGSTLIAGSGSSVVLINGAQAGNVFYRVGSSATLSTSSTLEGQIVALTSITLNTSAKINCGSAYARVGSVTLDSNTIQICTLAGRGFDAIVTNPILTKQQRDVSKALSDFVAGGGALPIGIAILAATQTPAELAISLTQMSGEVATAIAPMGMQSMNAFLDAVMGTGHNSRVLPRPLRNEGVPIGLVPEKINGTYTGKYDAPTPQILSFQTTQAEQSSPWDIWASGYGSHNVTDGDTRLGSHERTSSNHGFSGGLNFSPSPGKDLGIAVSLNKASFSLSNSLGSGTSDSVFVALRGRRSNDHAYLEGAVAYGRSNITTDRTVTIAGVDRLVGETTSDSLAGHVEAGYHMGVFTPFVGLRAHSITTTAFSETVASGSSSYALHYDENTTTSLRSELGADFKRPTVHTSGGTTTFGLRAAWAHEFATNSPNSRSFLRVPGAEFQTSGASGDRDSLILGASVGIAASNGIYVDAALNGDFSQNARDFGGSVKVSYRW